MNNSEDADDDNDGVPDADDAFPIDPAESADTDGDGIGDNADTDDDGDGVADTDDALPLDATETVDSDGDGVGDNGDVFPEDASESADYDGDGIGDNADVDDDGDGVPDVDDQFPMDPGASMDTDGDGVPDSRDRYPTHPGEWANSDNSGFGDNRDTDDDNDGVEDKYDLFPLDASRSDLTSVRFDLGSAYNGFTPSVATAGDLDGDGRDEVLILAPDGDETSVLYVVSAATLSAADGVDGARDGSVIIDRIPAQDGSWKVRHTRDFATDVPMSALGDLDGDGKGEFLVGDTASPSNGYVVSGADLLGADARDELADSVITLTQTTSQAASWRFRGLFRGRSVRAAAPADFDGDGIADLAIGQPGIGDGDSPGMVFLHSVNSLSTK